MTDLLALDKKIIWHPFTPLKSSQDSIAIKSAEGIYLNTADGKKIIDAISSWWVNLHGHSNPKIAEAIYAQAKNLEHVIFAGFTHEPAIKLAQNLLTILPQNQSRIFFSDNGSTAVEVAIKMAIQYWHNLGIKKKRIIAMEGAYHGDTFGSMSVGERGLFTAPFSNYLFQVDFIPFPKKSNEEKTISEFKKFMDDSTAVFIYEPIIQGAAGMRTYSAACLNDLLTIAKKNNVLCIADEVFTGFGRTGKYFASDYLETKPDIIAVSKGITGGTLPLGATSCSSDILSAFDDERFDKTLFHGHSYTANPISCAAANASFEILTGEECQNNIAEISKIQSEFADKLKNHSKVKHVDHLGTILSIEIQTEGKTQYTNKLRNEIYSWFIKKGILLRPLGNVIYIVPPYIIKQQELEYIHQEILGFLEFLNQRG